MTRPKMTLGELRALADREAALGGDAGDDQRYRAAASAAGAWLHKNSRLARQCLVARVLCPQGKRVADLYRLPENIAPVGDSGGRRLLIRPTVRGTAIRAGGDTGAWFYGESHWYMSDDDVWDLRCKCCPHPQGGVRAADLFTDLAKSYRLVLA